ncbi:hypothetical protein ACLB2K_025907 [Fragaria x ananassa]
MIIEYDWESDLRKLLLYKWRYVVSVALIESVLKDSPICQKCKAIYLGGAERPSSSFGDDLTRSSGPRGRWLACLRDFRRSKR